MKKEQGAVVDRRGNAIGAVDVTVYNTGTAVKATLYSDNGITPQSNPFQADSMGRWAFYTANGRYDIEFSGGMINTYKMIDVLLEDVGDLTEHLFFTEDSIYFGPNLNSFYYEPEDSLHIQNNKNGAYPTLILTNLNQGVDAQTQFFMDVFDSGGNLKRWQICVDYSGHEYEFQFEALNEGGVIASPLSLGRTGGVGVGMGGRNVTAPYKLGIAGDLLLSGQANATIGGDTKDGSNNSGYFLKGGGTDTHIVTAMGTGGSSKGMLRAQAGGEWGSDAIYMMHDGADGHILAEMGRIFVEPATGVITVRNNATDETTKVGRLTVGHYLNAEEPLYIFGAASTVSAGFLAFGGGSVSYNAATQIDFYTAADNTTLTGTKRMHISSAGNIGIGTDTFDGSAVTTLALANATPPAAHTDNQIYLYSVDSSDALATLGLMLEQEVEDIGTFTANKKIKIKINSTEYWVQLDAV